MNGTVVGGFRSYVLIGVFAVGAGCSVCVFGLGFQIRDGAGALLLSLFELFLFLSLQTLKVRGFEILAVSIEHTSAFSRGFNRGRRGGICLIRVTYITIRTLWGGAVVVIRGICISGGLDWFFGSLFQGLDSLGDNCNWASLGKERLDRSARKRDRWRIDLTLEAKSEARVGSRELVARREWEMGSGAALEVGSVGGFEDFEDFDFDLDFGFDSDLGIVKR